MKQYFIIIRDDLNNGEEVNRSDFFDNADDAIQWGKDNVDVQGWFWVLEETDIDEEEEVYSDGPPSIRHQAIGMNHDQIMNLLISTLDSLNKRINTLETELKLHVNYH